MYSGKEVYRLKHHRNTMKPEKTTKNQRFLEKYITAIDIGLETQLRMVNDGKDVSRNLANSAILTEIKKCPDCKREATATISYTVRGVTKKQGCCRNHWIMLSETNVGWTTA